MAEAKRKLAAILSADVVGYSQLMHADEAATVATLKEYRAAIARVIERHKGRVVNAPGDNILADFPSAVEAVQGACEIQQVLKGRNLELPPERRMEFRIGVNLGDVIEEADGTIYGDGVNIAARMEALADAGGVCISNTIYDAIEGKLDFGFDFLGEQQVKNIAKPVRVYRVRAELSAEPARPVAGKGARAVLIAASAAAVVVALAGLVTWQVSQQPEPEQIAQVTSEDDTMLALPTGPTVAVLPFVNLSDESGQEYFSDGLTEDIISALSRFRQLVVIPRSSSFQYKGRALDVREVGRALGARFVIEGSVRKSGDRIRVRAELLDSTDGAHLWGETFDRDLTVSNIFDVQDEITSQVVAVLADIHGIISRIGQREANAKRPDSLDAYDCVLRAYAYFRAITAEEHLSARDCLERALELDPDYAHAAANLTWMYLHEHQFGYNPRPELYDPLSRALDVAQRAVELDPTDHVAHEALASSYFNLNELESFFPVAERAIALNPNDSEVLADMGWQMAYAGKWDRGIALVRKAIALNPNHPGWYYIPVSFDHYRKGEYAQALAAAKKINMPDFYRSHLTLALSYAQLGRNAEAQAALARMLELYPEFADDPRTELEKWFHSDELIEHMLDGLSKAGLDIQSLSN